MFAYVLVSCQKDGIVEFHEAVTLSKVEENPNYLKDRKSQVKLAHDGDYDRIEWITIELDYRKMMQVLYQSEALKSKMMEITGEAHANHNRRTRSCR